MGVVGVVIGGALIGLLGSLFVSKHIPIWLTIGCGIGGAVGTSGYPTMT